MASIIAESLFEMMSCALSSEMCKHTCQEPVSLHCNHLACRKCLESHANYNLVICNPCKKIVGVNKANMEHPQRFDDVLNLNLNQAFKAMYENYKKGFDTYKKIMDKNKNVVKINIDSISQEMDQRFNDVHYTFYCTYCGMMKQLEKIKVKPTSEIDRLNNKSLNGNRLRYLQSKFNELGNDLNHLQELTKRKLRDFQNEFKVDETNVDSIDQEIEKRFKDILFLLFLKYYELRKKLEDLKIKWTTDLEKLNDKSLNEYRLRRLQCKFNELENNLKYQQALTKRNFYDFQNEFKVIEEAIKGINTPGYVFYFNNMRIPASLFDYIIYMSVEDHAIIQKIKSNKIATINMKCQTTPFDICELNRDTFLIVGCENIEDVPIEIRALGRVILLPPYFCYCTSIVTDSNYIYLTSHTFKKILKLGNNFGILKEYFDKKNRNKPSCSEIISGACWYNGSLYVIPFTFEKYDQNKILKFSDNLDCETKYKIRGKGKPLSIRNINNVACITYSDDQAIRFYNMDNFSLLRLYEGHNGCVGVSKFCFYEYFHPQNVIYCYNTNGELFEKFELSGFNRGTEVLADNQDRLCIYNSNLIIFSLFNTFFA